MVLIHENLVTLDEQSNMIYVNTAENKIPSTSNADTGKCVFVCGLFFYYLLANPDSRIEQRGNYFYTMNSIKANVLKISV